MSNYTEMEVWDRKILHATITDIAHKSDEFLQKIQDLIKEYSTERNSKIGLEEINFKDE